ncbi:MAG: O-antigen ligase family protein, partial [Candidatus Eisenbacteria bacterium]
LLLLGLLFFLPVLLDRGKRIRYAAGALVVGGGITAAYGIFYYGNDPSTRLGGFVGNYMSTGGILMMISLVAFSLLFHRRVGGALPWIAGLLLPVLLAALYLTDTRGAWLGLLGGLLALVLLVRRRLVLIPILLLAVLLAFPGKPRDTALSAVRPDHPRNRERLFMWKAGIEIFRDHPWTGVGLAGMREIYADYQDPDSEERAVHLHSVPIQVLASMGILGFAAWVYLFGSLLLWLLRAHGKSRDGRPVFRALTAGAVAVWTGFVLNGFVEWNLGDVEVITLLWAVMGLAVSSAGAARAVSPDGAAGRSKGAGPSPGTGPSV